jgi:hypothetical protein
VPRVGKRLYRAILGDDCNSHPKPSQKGLSVLAFSSFSHNPSSTLAGILFVKETQCAPRYGAERQVSSDNSQLSRLNFRIDAVDDERAILSGC